MAFRSGKSSRKPELNEKLHLNPFFSDERVRERERPENGTGFKMSTGVIYSLEIIIFPVSFMIISLRSLCCGMGSKMSMDPPEQGGRERRNN